VHDSLFATQQGLAPVEIRRIGVTLGLRAEWERCLDGGGRDKDADGVAERINKDVDQAQTLGIRSTPTVLIGPLLRAGTITVTSVVQGARPAAEYVRAVNTVLAAQQPSPR
jgi:hypothetical protein